MFKDEFSLSEIICVQSAVVVSTCGKELQLGHLG